MVVLVLVAGAGMRLPAAAQPSGDEARIALDQDTSGVTIRATFTGSAARLTRVIPPSH